MSGSFYFSVSFAERMPACTRKSKRERELLVGVRYFVVAIRKQLKPRGKWQYLVNMKKEKQEIGGRELLDRLTVCK